MMRESGVGLRIALNSPTNVTSFSRWDSVALLRGISRSSPMIISAREPVIWPDMDALFTDGDWSFFAGPTSNSILLFR